ncbi:MAG TPA: lactonase family protein [Devosia sp.]|jgi:6-phosphogluconolactonase|nr:lactonase family protein [Devosia sp.]
MPSALFYLGGVNREIGYVAKPAAEGIAAFLLDLDTGAARPLDVTKGIDNPTFVAVSPDGRMLAAVSEVGDWNEGLVTAYEIDPTSGALRYCNKQPTGGAHSCHIGFHPSAHHLGVANYGGLPPIERPNRSFSLYPLTGDTLGAPSAAVTHRGQGGDAERQSRPHAHCVRWSPDGRFVVVADLGIDRLLVYRFDAESGGVEPHGEVALKAGAGPRHVQFHPSLPVLYCVNELDCTLANIAYDAKAGALELIATGSTLARDGHADSSCSAIAITRDGKHLYVGNRGDDSIARFSLDPRDGTATLLGTTPAGGRVPRDLALDPSGTILAVANQESDQVRLFRYRAESGDLEAIGMPIAAGSPTAIAFHPQLR